ncbi:Ubiquitin fusion degradation protein 1 [Chionoecetes opilio]|uniref:Ubiquitin fusion degradation protein 1 n=1 Tax=Chionoecetes opilio TaxID=41210 RepID=A0A8J4XTW7_CHIOP|nr:Ubiquitin fusion degradation protein 1 [Chionoecetes opilio]
MLISRRRLTQCIVSHWDLLRPVISGKDCWFDDWSGLWDESAVKVGGAGQQTHALRVLEFVADEGKVYIPYWMMRNLLLDEGELVHFDSRSLPVATFSNFDPQSVEFLDITNPKAVLENPLQNFACLTQDDVVALNYNDRIYEMRVLEGSGNRLDGKKKNPGIASRGASQETTKDKRGFQIMIMSIDGPTSSDTGFTGPVCSLLSSVNEMQYNAEFRGVPGGEDLAEIPEYILVNMSMTSRSPTSWSRL